MDITKGGRRTYLYYRVDPDTWEDAGRIDTITGGSIARDGDDELLERATLSADASEDLDEQYVRIYQEVEQKGLRERICMGTFLAQAPDEHFDGTRSSVEAQCFSPYKELADDEVGLGFQVTGDAAQQAAAVMRAHMRAPVVAPPSSAALDGALTAGSKEKAISFVDAILAPAALERAVNPRGFALIVPKRDAAALQPVRTFRDDDESVILPDLDTRSGRRDVPNYVKVVYSDGDRCLVGEAVNADPASPVSTVSRGRRVPHTVDSPDLPAGATQADVDNLARATLKALSCAEMSVTFWHAYDPDVTLGSAVELDYSRAGKRVVAVVAAQGIALTPECTVQCRAKYTEQLWRG